MESLTRRTFAKVSAVAAATVVAPRLASGRLAASMAPREPSTHDETLQSEFLLELTLDTQAPHQTGAGGGGLLVVPVTGGTFDGPRMKGTVIGPGGDWIVERTDGSRVLDVRMLLLTDDAQTIYMSWRGIAYTPPGGQLVARIMPLFETGAARYSWLNSVCAVGVYRGAGKIAYRVYQIL
jgi:uncharacterized protein DUF3237